MEINKDKDLFYPVFKFIYFIHTIITNLRHLFQLALAPLIIVSETGDVYFSIELEEYRFISQESANANDVTGMKERSTGAEEKTSTVSKGMDTMDAIHKAVHNVNKNISIAKQGLRKLNAVRAVSRLPAGSASSIMAIV